MKISNFKLKISNSRKGFTVIEIIIAMAVFLLISGAAVGIFISVIHRQREVLNEQELLNQISYAQEYMSRALRMAKAATSKSDIDCLGGTVDISGNIYVFTQYDGTSGSYKGIKFLNQSEMDFEGNALCEEFFPLGENPVLMVQKGSDNPIPLTSSGLDIHYVKFAVNGRDGVELCGGGSDECVAATNQDGEQPRVTILMKVEFAGQPARIIQTTVSQRNLNINPQPQ